MNIKKIFLSTMLLPFTVGMCGAWGQKGHDVTARIAEQHLTPAAAAAVDSLLDGRSLVYWANWLDNASHTPAYAYTKTWHYKNIEPPQTYNETPDAPDGDVVTAIRLQLDDIANPAKTKAQKAVALQMLVHLVGDLHQPMHMGHRTDRGGNGVHLKYFGRDNNLHSIWDTSLLESAHKWGYQEWTDQLDRLKPEQVLLAQAGTIDDWGAHTAELASTIYAYFTPDRNYSYDDVARWAPVIEDQLLLGGLRLARLLNQAFE